MKFPGCRNVIPALATAFHQDLSLDADGIGTLAECAITYGVDVILVNGCTSESWSPTSDERDATVARSFRRETVSVA